VQFMYRATFTTWSRGPSSLYICMYVCMYVCKIGASAVHAGWLRRGHEALAQEQDELRCNGAKVNAGRPATTELQ